MAKRINIVLPEDTLRLLNRVTSRGSRSRLISEAVQYFIANNTRKNLAARLKEGAVANAERDLDLAQDWFSLDEEAWRMKRRSAARKV